MRLFLAIDLSEEIKAEIKSKLPILKKEIKANNWSPLDNYHITLLFIGNTNQLAYRVLVDSIRNGTKDSSSFTLTLSNLGAFPNIIKGRILWVGIKGDLSLLNDLQQKIVQATLKVITPNDLKDEYQPHITLARKVTEDNLKDKIGYFTFQPLNWQVKEFHLYESISTPNGVRYVKKETFLLQ